MEQVRSADGTTIAYDRAGSGPVVVFVPGAFNDRTTCAALAERLRGRYTVVCPDRRGRGQSTDAITDPATYEVQREIDDLDAIIAAEGGSAAVFGFSSGAILALRAAVAGSSITKLALYEAPFAIGGLTGAAREGLPAKLAALVNAGKPGDAVSTMQLEGIGLPAEMVAQIRQAPFFPQLEAIAQTVVYDATICAAPNVPTPEMTRLDVETLVLSSAESWPGLRSASEELVKHLARARYVDVPGGADHTIPADATAKILDDFLAG
jgi:pimeloyl-ACP methyl ester carboxylesterase